MEHKNNDLKLKFINAWKKNWIRWNTPKAFLKDSNRLESKAFVKISASVFISMYSKGTVLLSTKSLMKWWWMLICLVLECWTGFLEILIALVLSQNTVKVS